MVCSANLTLPVLERCAKVVFRYPDGELYYGGDTVQEAAVRTRLFGRGPRSGCAASEAAAQAAAAEPQPQPAPSPALGSMATTIVQQAPAPAPPAANTDMMQMMMLNSMMQQQNEQVRFAPCHLRGRASCSVKPAR